MKPFIKKLKQNKSLQNTPHQRAGKYTTQQQQQHGRQHGRQ